MSQPLRRRPQWSRPLWPLCVVAAGFLAACGMPAPSVADRATIRVHVLPNGTVRVHEQLVVRFGTGAADQFERRIASSRVDELAFVSASLDSVQLPIDAPGRDHVTVDEGRQLHVRWTFQPLAERARAFDVVYEARGAVMVEGSYATFRWPVIPSHRGYPIEHNTVEFDLPATSHFLGSSGMAEMGWSIALRPLGMVMSHGPLTPDEGATLLASFAVIPGDVAEPLWQTYALWGQQLVPAFIAGAIFILVIGVGTLWIVRFQYGTRFRRGMPLVEVDRIVSERPAVRQAMLSSAWVCLALAALTAGLVWVFLRRFGWGPLLIPASIALVGVALLVFRGIVPQDHAGRPPATE